MAEVNVTGTYTKRKKTKAKEKYKFQLKYFDEKLTTFPTLKL